MVFLGASRGDPPRAGVEGAREQCGARSSRGARASVRRLLRGAVGVQAPAPPGVSAADVGEGRRPYGIREVHHRLPRRRGRPAGGRRHAGPRRGRNAGPLRADRRAVGCGPGVGPLRGLPRADAPPPRLRCARRPRPPHGRARRRRARTRLHAAVLGECAGVPGPARGSAEGDRATAGLSHGDAGVAPLERGRGVRGRRRGRPRRGEGSPAVRRSHPGRTGCRAAPA
ncbi:hypothetical protein SRABI128_04193 [Microbacterium sp. Bi128]|nr:hypothetical protein SRABI128_04193 [Microbacterium sp. Bi128]